MLSLGLKSLLNRRFVSILTIISIALSVCLVVGVERMRAEARAGFTNSAAGIDMIVASRGHPVQILLATVFGVGSTGNAIRWDTFEAVRKLDAVAWAVPIAMGDNYRGFPVIGTRPEYFTHMRHSGGAALVFGDGRVFDNTNEAVLGAEAAGRFDLQTGDQIALAHGSGDVAFHVHDQAPFTIVGVLGATGTAVDRMVLVSLRGFDGLHAREAGPLANPLRDPLGGPPGPRPAPALEPSTGGPDDDHDHDHDHNEGHHEPDSGHGHEGEGEVHEEAPEARQLNAVFLGLRDRTAVLGLQRYFSEYTGEPLTAVMPSVALLELWSMTGTAEKALSLMALAVALAGMLGLLATLSAALDARRREFAVLRAVGASPGRVFSLILLEAAMLTGAGLVLGYGVLMLVIFAAGLLASLVPAFRVYRLTLADGLTSVH